MDKIKPKLGHVQLSGEWATTKFFTILCSLWENLIKSFKMLRAGTFAFGYLRIFNLFVLVFFCKPKHQLEFPANRKHGSLHDLRTQSSISVHYSAFAHHKLIPEFFSSKLCFVVCLRWGTWDRTSMGGTPPPTPHCTA